ncbi:hypothetical protein [Anaerotruncus massiliensis (ex Togo et al. 2019)]|uniref:Uncharacterized protein n=1 Tax=Anaerotruncus massiliensis (ex Togo et al. 2019) TaxID=1673720 RepID=A0ABR7ADP9_9FIRM|nr:hypothetical protein [Anaerotruncus massiliensis (ex Togo et al. 2019)]MBC3938511.1 hypothetical protein [Anaerotruncus massiliensis (ex Togo et al. 2019)]
MVIEVEKEITLRINSVELDEAIEKANRLVELLREASQIIDSLNGPLKVEGLVEKLTQGINQNTLLQSAC